MFRGLSLNLNRHVAQPGAEHAFLAKEYPYHQISTDSMEFSTPKWIEYGKSAGWDECGEMRFNKER